MDIDSRSRLKKLLFNAALICIVGLGYALFCMVTHWGIPCPIHAVTGLYCPGCGISRMCIALLRFDFPTAMHWNAGVMVALPFAAVVFCYQAVRYVRTGDVCLQKWQNVLLWGIIGWLLVFTILRNFL